MKWISGAVKRPGKYTKSVKERYGEKGFDSKGHIKKSISRVCITYQ